MIFLLLTLLSSADGEEVGASDDDSDGMACDDATPAAADDDSGSDAGDAADAATASEPPVDDEKYDRDMDLEEEEATLRKIRGKA